jgi:hypothetical protein
MLLKIVEDSAMDKPHLELRIAEDEAEYTGLEERHLSSNIISHTYLPFVFERTLVIMS